MMSRVMVRGGWAVLAVVVMAAAGCGEKSDRPTTYGATGAVTLGGSPVAGAAVTFVPVGGSGTPAVGTTDASGKFSLTSFGTENGALPGEYQVQITKYEGAAAAAGGASGTVGDGQMPADYQNPTAGADTGPKNALPAKYESAANSELKATVTTDPSKNVFNFPLEAAQ